MIISAADMQNRLNHPKNSAKNRNLAKSGLKERTVEDLDRNDKPAGPDLYIRETGSGRKEGDTDIPPELAVPAAILARLGGNQQEIGDTFGISQRKVSGLKNGETSDETEDLVKEALSPIRETIVNKIGQSLDFMTSDKFRNAKAGELANVARNLSNILEDTRDKSKDARKESNLKIVIHGAERVEVEKYEVIEVS